MTFSEGWKNGVSPDREAWDGSREEHEVKMCAYPNCRHTKIARDEHAVFWDGVHLSKDVFESNLSPLGKLAVVANPSDYTEKYGYYYVTLAMHAECAAEWGMHLIKDALGSHNVGTKLRKEKTQNAIREQT